MLVSALSFPASAALAQDWQLDVGGTSVRYDSVTTIRSGSLSPQVEWSGSSVLVSAGATLAALDSSWTGQGQGDVSLVLGRARRLQGWGPAALLSTAGSLSQFAALGGTGGEAATRLAQLLTQLEIGRAHV